MSIDTKKINVLEGPWVDDEYYKSVYPRIEKSKIPSFRQQTLSITQLYNDAYWGKLRSVHRIDIGVPDPRHWFLNDDEFDFYVERLSSVNFPVFCIFESPLENELDIELEVVVKKLFERASKLAKTIKDKNPSTVILSPAIGAIKEEHNNLYFDFFVHNRNLFDGYAVHCCNDMTDHSLGQVSSFLNQVMKTLPKPLWITKWAVPCYDEKIINRHMGGDGDFVPHKSGAAGQRINRSFNLIESIATLGSRWFYTGLGRDLYKPRRVPGTHECWNSNSVPISFKNNIHAWQYWHFLGMYTSSGDLKSSLFNSFIQTSLKNNG